MLSDDLKSKDINMRQIYYFYDPVIKSNDKRYSIDYYCTDGKHIVWAGQLNGDNYIYVLNMATKFIEDLNKPRSIFGRHGRLSQLLWWMKRKRN